MRKILGQHFLINQGVHKKIVTALDVRPENTILEIGPGTGLLTKHLVETGAKIIAVEKDLELVDRLRSEFANTPNLEIVSADIRSFKPENCKLSAGGGSAFGGKIENYKVVGNIPYYLSSHLLRIIFERWPTPSLMVVMLQKEVAQKIVARPPKMSLLSAMVQFYAEPKIIANVSRNSFNPPPEVDSAILKLVPHSKYNTSESVRKNFFKVLTFGFSQKRRQLGRNIADVMHIDRKIIDEKLIQAGIDPNTRPETLTIEQWLACSRLLTSSNT